MSSFVIVSPLSRDDLTAVIILPDIAATVLLIVRVRKVVPTERVVVPDIEGLACVVDTRRPTPAVETAARCVRMVVRHRFLGGGTGASCRECNDNLIVTDADLTASRFGGSGRNASPDRVT